LLLLLGQIRAIRCSSHGHTHEDFSFFACPPWLPVFLLVFYSLFKPFQTRFLRTDDRSSQHRCNKAVAAVISFSLLLTASCAMTMPLSHSESDNRCTDGCPSFACPSVPRITFPSMAV